MTVVGRSTVNETGWCACTRSELMLIECRGRALLESVMRSRCGWDSQFS